MMTEELMNWSHWNIENDDKDFVYKIIAKAPKSLWKHIRRYYNNMQKEHGRQHTNLSMIEIKELLKSVNFNLASDDEEIRDRASKEAKHCSSLIKKSQNKEYVDIKISTNIRKMGIKPPKSKNLKGRLSRYECEKWWRRQLRKVHGRTLEALALKLNIINKFNNIYASDVCVNRRIGQKVRNTKILDNVEAVNEQGDSFSLLELADKSTSNPKIRRSELMTRIAGNEKIADELGHMGLFLTLTCPSRMHSSLNKSGKRNPIYDGTRPKEAQKYLTNNWAHIRTAFSNRKIKYYGIRVVEPHHDGTPHWHFLLFIDPKDKDELLRIFRQHALKTDGDEKGAQKHRFKVEFINKKKGTATGYIAKYISKNIDGHEIDFDLYGHDAKNSAIRIEAWASNWGIRQFQFFGNPPVTVWRELRRIKETDNPTIKLAVKAADEGDWAAFIDLMGGPCTEKELQPIAIMRVWSDKLNDYDEPIGYQILGVEFGNEHEISRIHIWEIRSTKESNNHSSPWGVNNFTETIPVSITIEDYVQPKKIPDPNQRSKEEIREIIAAYEAKREEAEKSAQCAPWSSVNNCTLDKNIKES